MKAIQYTELPKHLTHLLWVNGAYRTNPLSLEDGGVDLITEHHNGRSFGYDKIKMPSRYILAMDNLSQIKRVYVHKQDDYDLSISGQKRLYRLTSKSGADYSIEASEKPSDGSKHFAELWNSQDDFTLLEALKTFDNK
jgi:hypothetical protein